MISVSALAPSTVSWSNSLLHQAVSQETGALMKRFGVQSIAETRSQSIKPIVPEPDSIDLRLFNALSQAKIQTSQVAMHLSRHWRQRLFIQLDRIHEADEWQLDETPVDGKSFSTFLKAIIAISPNHCPSIGMTKDGNLVCAWQECGDRLILEFLAGDRVRWRVLITTADEPQFAAGEAPIRLLQKTLSVFNPNRWLPDVDYAITA